MGLMHSTLKGVISLLSLPFALMSMRDCWSYLLMLGLAFMMFNMLGKKEGQKLLGPVLH